MKDPFFAEFEQASNNNNVTVEINGIHVSSNVYYGFQPTPQQTNLNSEHIELMEVQVNDSDIQFNNLIAPELDERLNNTPSTDMQRESRKRPWSDEDYKRETHAKKPRDDQLHGRCKTSITNANKTGSYYLHSDSRDEQLEELLVQIHGGTMHHWLNHELF